MPPRRLVGFKRPNILTRSGISVPSLLLLLLTITERFGCVYTIPLKGCGESVSDRLDVRLRDNAPPAFREFDTAIDTRNQIVVLTDNFLNIDDMPNERKKELLSVLRANLRASHVAQVHLLGEASSRGALSLETFPQANKKLFTHELDSRMTFFTAIEYANRCLPRNTTFVIANADIMFVHESTRLLPRFLLPNAVVALTRHNLNEKGDGLLHSDPGASQDVWSMKTPFQATRDIDFPLGYLGSDNRVAYLLNQMNATLYNWCTDVIVWHYHFSNSRGDKERLPEPYTFVEVSRPKMSWFEYNIILSREPLGGQGTRMINVLRADMPRLASNEAWTSHRESLQFSPPWTGNALKVAVETLEQASKRNKDSGRSDKSASHDREQRTSSAPLRSFPGRLYFLDICWDAWLHDSYLGRWETLIGELNWSVPAFDVNSTLVLVPPKVGSFLCQTQWSSMFIGTHNSDGSFREFIDCKKRPSKLRASSATQKKSSFKGMSMERGGRRQGHGRKRTETRRGNLREIPGS